MDLDSDYAVSKTLQVNDIGSLSTRQSSLTSKIKLPKTTTNLAALGFLSVGGNTSNIPYQRNNATLLDETGEALIYNGWADVIKTNKAIEMTVYDGIYDFQKTLENKTLTDMGLSELNHLKNLHNVLETWSATTLPYRYNIADYNGKTIFHYSGATTTRFNIDYFIPAAKVEFIWNKIFNYAGYTYDGSIFQTEDFKNLWMTYPKPVGSTNQALEFINHQDWTDPLSFSTTFPTDFGFAVATVYESTLLTQCFTSTAATSVQQTDGHCRAIKVDADGLYRFNIEGSLYFPPNANASYGIALQRVNLSTNVVTYTPIVQGITGATDLDISYSFTMTDEERVGLHLMNFQYGNIPFTTNSHWQPNQVVGGNLDIDFYKVLGDVVNFDEALIEFKATDFVMEIIKRYGLTMYKDKYTKKLTFLTLGQLLTTDNIDLWDEDIEIVEEEYSYGNYAQQNLFTYKYNEDNASHFNGSIAILNPNLKDENTVISSKFYAPEAYDRYLIGKRFRVYKFWDKEVKDDGEVEYKPLDKRFYLMRSEPYIMPLTTNIDSEAFGQTTTFKNCYVENYNRMGMTDVIEDYYLPMQGILNRSKVVTVNKWFTSKEITDFDFRKLIYLEKLGEYFIINKVADYVVGKPTKTELVNVKFFAEEDDDNNGGNPPEPQVFQITNMTQSGCSVTFNFETDTPFPILLYITATEVLFGQVFGTAMWLPDATTTFTITDLPVPANYHWVLNASYLGGNIATPNYTFLLNPC
ncbi:hypothetical protein [Flavobacterium sp.]|uniref:hypothetical protein n=1 Tax=Flavobacterium sp. TaxID=239 RepID=UPI0025BDAF73|nr:hypothetical protein [Flavobacterium sp.]